MPSNGEGLQPVAGWYIYRTKFYVPQTLPGGVVPAGFSINGHLASDNATFTMYLEDPAGSGGCHLVASQIFPINPTGSGFSDFQQWWDFSIVNPIPLTPGSYAFLDLVMVNAYDHDIPTGESPTGLRVEFFSSSSFH